MDILLNNICKSYGENAVLRSFCHAFPGGETSCVLGPSGCGKTTLLRIIAGLENVDSGSVSGMEGRRISAVFQENRLLEGLSAEKNVLLTARPGFTRSEARVLLSALGLPAGRKPVSEYSGGMKRRVAIARALAAQYDVLLLDEPLTGLDPETRELALRVILEASAGKTCIWITHSEETARKISRNILNMQRSN